MDVKAIEEAVEKTDEETQRKVNWTELWGRKYPVLLSYQDTVQVDAYADRLKEMLESLKRQYGYTDLDAFLVLKDILAQLWNSGK